MGDFSLEQIIEVKKAGRQKGEEEEEKEMCSGLQKPRERAPAHTADPAALDGAARLPGQWQALPPSPREVESNKDKASRPP